MRVKTWKVLDWGDVPADAPTVPYECGCGREAQLPVLGRVIAITGGHDGPGDDGLLFDPGPHATPRTIQCRKCGRVLKLETADVR